MKRVISAGAFAVAIATAAYAQDNTVKSRTQIKADDAKAVTATGCLAPGIAPGVFTLRGGITARGEELTTTTRTRTDVDRDETTVKSETKVEADGDHNRVRAGKMIVFDLSPRAGVDLAAHAGQQVQVTAIVLDRGAKDAEVTVKEDTRIDREHGSDGKTKSETRIDVERGDGPRLTVLSVKPLGQSCT